MTTTDLKGDKTLLLISLAILAAFLLYLVTVGLSFLGPLEPIFTFLSFLGVVSLAVFAWEDGEYSLVYIPFSILLMFLSCFMTVGLFVSPFAFVFAFLSFAALMCLRQFILTTKEKEEQEIG